MPTQPEHYLTDPASCMIPGNLNFKTSILKGSMPYWKSGPLWPKNFAFNDHFLRKISVLFNDRHVIYSSEFTCFPSDSFLGRTSRLNLTNINLVNKNTGVYLLILYFIDEAYVGSTSTSTQIMTLPNISDLIESLLHISQCIKPNRFSPGYDLI